MGTQYFSVEHRPVPFCIQSMIVFGGLHCIALAICQLTPTCLFSLIGPMLLGYLDVTPRSKDSQETKSYLPKASNDGFAMPAPRPPTKKALPRLLSNSKSDDESEEEDILMN